MQVPKQKYLIQRDDVLFTICIVFFAFRFKGKSCAVSVVPINAAVSIKIYAFFNTN